MRVTIIVPALNEEAIISQALDNLKRLRGDTEIVVVDGGSTDQTVPLALSQHVRVISSERGRGHQMHAGACQASGEVLWFVHADTLPPANAIEVIHHALEDPRVAGGNFGLTFDGISRAARQLTFIYPALRILRLSYGDSGIFVRREIYEQIGGFHALALFEDLDLLKRLRRAGRFVHLECAIIASSRRFENRNFALMWIHWTALQVLYWCGVPPNFLARWYGHVRQG